MGNREAERLEEDVVENRQCGRFGVNGAAQSVSGGGSCLRAALLALSFCLAALALAGCAGTDSSSGGNAPAGDGASAPVRSEPPRTEERPAAASVDTYYVRYARGKTATQLTSVSGEVVDLPDGYQVVGPYSNGLAMVRWLETSDDRWGVGTDGNFDYGFMDASGNLKIKVDDAAASIGLPAENDEGAALRCTPGAYFQEDRAVLDCRYGASGNGYHFSLVIDEQGSVVAWTGLDGGRMDVAAAASLPYTSFPDSMELVNFPNFDISSAYEKGLLQTSLGTSLAQDHTILLDADGEVYANFYGSDSYVRSSDLLNSRYVVGGLYNVCSYEAWVPEANPVDVFDIVDILEAEDFDDAQIVGMAGDGPVVIINAQSNTAKGERVLTGLYDFEAGSWVVEPVLGGSAQAAHYDVFPVSIEGKYNESYEGGSCGLMSPDGMWLFAPDVLYDGEICSEFTYLHGSYWLAKVGKGDSERSYLIDAANPSLQPTCVEDLVLPEDFRETDAMDEELIEGASSRSQERGEVR